jgi:hypothetical protein
VATVSVNRAPVLALWASVVAERLGYSRAEALSLGKALTGLTAQSKGRHLGIYHRRETPGAGRTPKRTVELMGRELPVTETPEGLRAVAKDALVSSESAERYLEARFGPELARVREAMSRLAGAFEPDELAGRAFALYEEFRPNVPPGVKGWGAKGVLDIGLIAGLAARRGGDR